MAAFQVKSELATLEQARSRLEAALSGDENWRALKQSGAPGGDAGDSAARRARDARLEKALGGNPLYQAWKHVDDAIQALRATGADGERPVEPVVPAAPDGRSADAIKPAPGARSSDAVSPMADGLDSEDLPEDIARLIRRSASQDPGSPAHAAAADDDSKESTREGRPAPVEAAALVGVPEIPVVAKASTEPPTDEESLADPAKPASAPPSAVADNGAAPAHGTGPERPHIALEPDEATVTFVLRETRPSLLPSAELPPDLGTDRKSTLFERLRGVSEGIGEPDDAFTSPDGSAEEAEVVIVTPESAKARRQAEQRSGKVRRFLKALSGDDPSARD